MPGATIRTDGSAIYGPLQEDGFGHEPFVQLGSKIPAHVSLPGVHRVISLLKRWLLGTHQGAVDPRHVLPRRIYVPLQPTLVTITRNAVLPVVAAIGRNNAGDLRQHTGQRASSAARLSDRRGCGAKWIARSEPHQEVSMRLRPLALARYMAASARASSVSTVSMSCRLVVTPMLTVQ